MEFKDHKLSLPLKVSFLMLVEAGSIKKTHLMENMQAMMRL